MSGSVARSYAVAASMGAVEALKDLGFARWNHTIRSINQKLRSNIRLHSHGGGAPAKAASSSSASELRDQVGRIKRSDDDKVRKVMELDCWGPSTLRKLIQVSDDGNNQDGDGPACSQEERFRLRRLGRERTLHRRHIVSPSSKSTNSSPKLIENPIMSIRWPRLLNPTQLSQILRLQKNPLTALHIFNTVKSKHPSYRHNGDVYATMIGILQTSGKLSEMKDVINQMKGDSCELKDKVAASAIKTFADAGQVDEAVSLFRSLPEFNCVNWTCSFTTLLEIMMKESKLESFHRVFVENCGRWEVKSRIGSLNLLMDCLCRINCSELALEVFQEMSLQHCYPDRESYRVLMRGLCNDGRLNEAVHLLYSMFWRVSQKGSGGDIVIYRTLLDCLCDHGKVNEAVEILGKVLWKGLKATKSRRKLPDLDNIRAYEDPQYAKALINEALVKCTTPSTASYGAVITNLYSEGNINEANKVLARMRAKGFETSPTIYEEKVNAFCREGLVDEAVKVVEEEMVQWSCVPTTKVFNAAVKGLCEKGRPIRAVKLLDKMAKQPGCAPNKETFGFIVDGLCRDGMIDEASKILERMLNNLHRPGINTFDAVVRGFCSVGRRYEVVLWLEEMINHGMVPEPALWDALIGLFCHDVVETGAQLESIILPSSDDV